MIVHLIRESDSALHAEAPGVPSHRVAANPFEDAEREVRRRVLRSLADRTSPPTAVIFVRTWEQQNDLRAGNCVHIAHPAQQLAIDAFRAEQAPEPARETEPAVPLAAPDATPRRGRRRSQ